MQASLTIDNLIEENLKYLMKFNHCKLMNLVKSEQISNKRNRSLVLDYLQIFSDLFQKIVMQRYISTTNPLFTDIAEQHLLEEFGHNLILRKNRNNRETPLDQVIQENADWFTKQMLVADDISKHILMHLVLESTADMFFKASYAAFLPYEEVEYLHLHDEADEEHAQMGMGQLAGIDLKSIDGLVPLFHEGWARLNTVCDRIAEKAMNSQIDYCVAA